MDIESNANHRPLRVGLWLIEGFALMSYAAIVEPMRAANLLGRQIQFDVTHLTAGSATATSSGGAMIATPVNIRDAGDLDLVLVVAGGDPASIHDKALFGHLRALDRKGVVLGGVSGGPFILANAGLMDGYRMTIHWEHAPALLEQHPGMLLDRTLYVMDRNRMTCAGGTAPLDMMHALIARRCGMDFARKISDWFMHTDIRPSGGPQRAGRAERFGVNNKAVIQVLEIMENNMADPLSLDDLARVAEISGRQLNRLFASHLGQTTMAFYKDLRLDMAKRLVGQTALSMTQIAFAAGFTSSAQFSSAFKQRFGSPPTALRTKQAQA